MQRCIVQRLRRSIAFTAVFSPDDPVNSPSDRYVPGIELMMRGTLHVKSRSWISMTRSQVDAMRRAEMRCRRHARRGSRDVGPIDSEQRKVPKAGKPRASRAPCSIQLPSPKYHPSPYIIQANQLNRNQALRPPTNNCRIKPSRCRVQKTINRVRNSTQNGFPSSGAPPLKQNFTDDMTPS